MSCCVSAFIGSIRRGKWTAFFIWFVRKVPRNNFRSTQPPLFYSQVSEKIVRASQCPTPILSRNSRAILSRLVGWKWHYLTFVHSSREELWTLFLSFEDWNWTRQVSGEEFSPCQFFLLPIKKLNQMPHQYKIVFVLGKLFTSVLVLRWKFLSLLSSL